MNAALALNAWFTYDALNRYNQRVTENEALPFDKRKQVIMRPTDYENLASYQLLNANLQKWILNAGTISQAMQAVNNLFKCNSTQESSAKACLAFPLLGRADIGLAVQKSAFQLVAKSYLPEYVSTVYEQRYNTAKAEERLKFFATIALWDRSVPSDTRLLHFGRIYSKQHHQSGIV